MRVSKSSSAKRRAKPTSDRTTYLDLGERLVELGLTARDDRDVCAPLGELAREREPEALGPAADIAVLRAPSRTGPRAGPGGGDGETRSGGCDSGEETEQEGASAVR